MAHRVEEGRSHVEQAEEPGLGMLFPSEAAADLGGVAEQSEAVEVCVGVPTTLDEGGLIQTPESASGSTEAGLHPVSDVQRAAESTDGSAGVSRQRCDAAMLRCEQIHHPVGFLEGPHAHHEGGGLDGKRPGAAHRFSIALQVPK